MEVSPAGSTPPKPPRLLFWLGPTIFLAHIIEEFGAGFPAWASAHFGRVTTPDFFLASHVPLVVSIAAIALWASRGGKHGVFLIVGAQAVLATNGLFHVVTTLLFREYSPGVVTSLVVYVPATIYLLKRLTRDGLISWASCAWAFLIGSLVSAGVVASLFVDRVLVP